MGGFGTDMGYPFLMPNSSHTTINELILVVRDDGLPEHRAKVRKSTEVFWLPEGCEALELGAGRWVNNRAKTA